MQQIAYALIIAVLGVYVLRNASFILVPVTWSIFISFSLMPLCNALERARVPRILAIALSILAVTIVIAVVVYVLIYQVSGLLDDAPSITRKLSARVRELRGFFANRLGVDMPSDSPLPDLSSLVGREQISNTLRSMFETAGMLTVIPIFVFFFIYYKDFFHAFLARLNKDTVFPWVTRAGKVVQGYLMGMMLVTLVVSLMAGILFYLVGVKYFVLFALFVAVFNLIPYVGVIFSSVVTVIYVFLITDTMLYPALTLFFLWLIQVIENNIITPVIVGARIKLNPLAVILSIVLGGSIWGISGMILGIPLVGILKIAFDARPSLAPYGYLLGDEVPVTESRENFMKILGRRWHRYRETRRK